MAENSNLTIIFDAVTKAVIVQWNDSVKMLYGPFENQPKARHAAERFAREMGWIEWDDEGSLRRD